MNKIFSAFCAIFSCGPFQETIGLAKDINKTENKTKTKEKLIPFFCALQVNFEHVLPFIQMFRKTQTETHSVSYETVKRMSSKSQPYIKLDRGFDWNSLISARNKAVGNLHAHSRGHAREYCLVCIGLKKKLRNIDQLSNTKKKKNEGNTSLTSLPL